MSFLREEIIDDPSCPESGMLIISPNVLLTPVDLVDVINSVRTRHYGVIGFVRGCIDKDELRRIPKVKGSNKHVGTCGWHIHGQFYAVNLSGGSNIPTLFASASEISRALSRAIRKQLPYLEVDPLAAQELPLDYEKLSGEVVRDSLKTIKATIIEAMELFENGIDALSLEQISAAWNKVRTLYGILGTDSRYMSFPLFRILDEIIKESQTEIPDRKILAVSPSEYDAYVIPPFRAHARSLREGQRFRPDGQTNMFIPIDKSNGQMWR